jgi:hypothetical protein
MNRKMILWPLFLGIIGFGLSRKHAYGARGTYEHDLGITVLYTLGSAVVGFLIATIVSTNKPVKPFIIVHWSLVGLLLGVIEALGVKWQSQSWLVVGGGLGFGLVIGLSHYLLSSSAKRFREHS